MGEVSAAVDNLMSQLQSTASAQNSAAQSLVQAAASALSSLMSPPVDLPLKLKARENVFRPRSPQPPDVDVDLYQQPSEIPLEFLKPLTDRMTDPIPTLDLPKVEPGYSIAFGNQWLREVDYSFDRADMDYSTLPLTTRVITEPDEFPDLTVPQRITAEPLSGTPPDVPAPHFGQFVLDYATPYRQGLDAVREKIASLHDALAQAKTALDPGDTDFINLLTGIMRQEVWSLPYKEWAAEVKNSEFQTAHEERSSAIQELDTQAPSVTGMPNGQQLASAVKIETETTRKEMDVLQKIDESLRNKEFEFYTLALSLGANITEAAFSLRFRQIELIQKAQQLVLAISNDIITLVSRVIDNKAQELDYYVRYNDAQVTRNKLSMEIEKTKLESLRADLGSNELVLSYNENNANVYSLAMRMLEQKIDHRKVETDYLFYEKRVELLMLDYFNLQLDQHKENLRLFLARQGKANADIKENAVVLDGEILKSKNYMSELAQQLANYKVEILNSKSGADNGRLELSLYSEKNNGLLAELEALEEVSRVAVKAIMAGVAAETLEKTLEAQQQEFEDMMTLYEVRRNLKIEQLDLLNEIKQFSFNAERIKSQANIMIQGASVAGGMATQAFAGLNGTATRIMTEFA